MWRSVISFIALCLLLSTLYVLISFVADFRHQTPNTKHQQTAQPPANLTNNSTHSTLIQHTIDNLFAFLSLSVCMSVFSPCSSPSFCLSFYLWIVFFDFVFNISKYFNCIFLYCRAKRRQQRWQQQLLPLKAIISLGGANGANRIGNFDKRRHSQLNNIL